MSESTGHRREHSKKTKDAATRSASSLYFIAAETPLFLTSMNAPWIFLFVAAALSLAMRSLLPAAPALSASALIAACVKINQCRVCCRLGLIDADAHLGLGRVVRRRLAAAHRLLRRAHETFHC